MTDASFDCIVVGVGGIGSATLYHLAKRGVRVLGIDRHTPGHDQGSSHGDSRIIRLLYFEHPDYVPLLRRAYELWESLEREADTSLLYKTGILQAGPPESELILGLKAAAAAHGLPLDELDSTSVAQRFSGFTIPAEDTAIFDPMGGVLRVEDCVRTHATLAVQSGATIAVPESARHWYREGDSLILETDQNRYRCQRLVITPGAWAPSLLPRLAPHLSILRKSLFWFEQHDDAYHVDNHCPAYLFAHGNHNFYGFPALDGKGIKVADHAGGQPIATPEDLDKHVNNQELEAVSLMLRHYLPRAGHQLNHHATCMYTMSTDGHFIVGQYPDEPDVSVVAGLSGHGFKFAPVLGEIMADLCLTGETRHAISFLSPDRF